MRHRSHIVITIMLAVLIHLLTGCFSSTDRSLTGSDAYNAAISHLHGSDFAVTISEMQQIQTNRQILSYASKSHVSYNDYATSGMRSSTEKAITIGQQSITVHELCTDSTIFLQVNDGSFSAPTTEEQAETRYRLCGLLDAALYDSVQFQYSEGHQIIGFSQPKAAESWAIPQEAQFLDASGKAILLADGSLYESTYSVTYTYGPVTVTYTVTATFDLQSKPNIKAPADLETYAPIANIDAPVLLETACAKLLDISAVSSQSVYDISCDAGGLQRTQKTQTQIIDSQAGLTAQVDTLVELTNRSQQGTTSAFSQTEQYANGNYTITSDNLPSEPSEPVTEDAMRSYCKNNLVNSILLPQYIEKTELIETADAYSLNFTATESLAQLLFKNAYQTLYADQTATDDLVDSYKTEAISGSITVSKYTGLPISSGLFYTGITAIDESTQAFNVTMEQQYSYPEE